MFFYLYYLDCQHMSAWSNYFLFFVSVLEIRNEIPNFLTFKNELPIPFVTIVSKRNERQKRIQEDFKKYPVLVTSLSFSVNNS